MSPFIKTNDSQATGIPPLRRRGGQPGNANAARSVNALSNRLRALKRRIRAALKAVR
jgi:hypothetical protein